MNKIFVLVTNLLLSAYANLQTYTQIPGYTESEHYQIKVRTLGGIWQKSAAMITRCKDRNNNEFNDLQYFASLNGWTNTYTNFIMDEPVEVEITSLDSNIQSAVVHPSQNARSVQIVNGKAYVIMDRPTQIAVDINGQMDGQNTGYGLVDGRYIGYNGPPIHTLTVFANPPIPNVPDTTDPKVLYLHAGEAPPLDSSKYKTLYFGAGIHNIDRGFPLWANHNYYIPGDAVIYGTFNSTHGGWNNGANIHIYGYGTLSGAKTPHPKYDLRSKTPLVASMSNPNNPILLQGAKNSTLYGITIEDSPYHSVQMWNNYSESDSTVVRWLKIFSWRANGDGIHPGSDMLIEDSFIRTQDDAVYVEGAGMRRNIIWNDANGSAFVLASTPSHSLVIEDIDVIYARASWYNWPGGRVFSLRAQGDSTKVAGGQTLFQNIRLSDPYPTFQAFFMHTSGDFPYSGGGENPVGSGLKGVTFKNIDVRAESQVGFPNVLHANASSAIHDITFDHVIQAGKEINNINFFDYLNEWVTNIHFVGGSDYTGLTPLVNKNIFENHLRYNIYDLSGKILGANQDLLDIEDNYRDFQWNHSRLFFQKVK